MPVALCPKSIQGLQWSMPYLISQTISEDIPPLWREPHAYKKESLHSIIPGQLPPVSYETHSLNAHSLTHIEAETHVVKDGKSLDYYMSRPEFFYGPCLVVKLKGDRYLPHWEVTRDELEKGICDALNGRKFPGKILLTSENYPLTDYGYHDPEKILTLSLEAAEFLLSFENFNLYGTTWKSSDYQPGSAERPIHKALFKKAVILECLDLRSVPEDIYFLSSIPLKIKGASESPVCPVLFSKEEVIF